jgi:3-hydroxyisobutyrate dehydrogenase-like beta-hydroxyacid dehydrogenase
MSGKQGPTMECHSLARSKTMQAITVLGLGSMGQTIARLFIERGHRVTVWNRSAGKAQGLAALGATVAATPAEALAASPLAVVCVYDQAATDAILATPGAAAAVRGRTLVQLTTISPDESRGFLAWAQQHGAALLTGAIQAAPSQMGQPDTPLLLSGDAGAWEVAGPQLATVAGSISYLGTDIAAAATMDLATLSYVYGAFAGFTHGARIAESQGLDVAHYGRLVQGISPSFGAFFSHEAKVIQSGDFRITESPLRISVEATRRILANARSTGISTEFPAFVDGLLQRADAAGLGDEELAALIKLWRTPAVA